MRKTKEMSVSHFFPLIQEHRRCGQKAAKAPGSEVCQCPYGLANRDKRSDGRKNRDPSESYFWRAKSLWILQVGVVKVADGRSLVFVRSPISVITSNYQSGHIRWRRCKIWWWMCTGSAVGCRRKRLQSWYVVQPSDSWCVAQIHDHCVLPL